MKRVPAARIRPAVPVALVLAACLAGLVAQHELVFLQHDDYGVAVLDYPAASDAGEAMRFGVLPLLEFLGGMYSEWSGRFVSLLALVLSLWAGLEFTRLLQSAIILALLFLAAALASRDTGEPVRAAPCLLAAFAFLCVPAGTLIDGVYWFSASSHYLWFLPLMLAACWTAGARRRLTPAAVALLSAAALAHEQLAAGALVAAVSILLLVEADRPQPQWRALPRLTPIGLAAALCLLAPGNFARARAEAAAFEGGLAARVRENAGHMAELFFAPGHDRNYFVYMILAATALLVAHAARQRPASRAWLWVALAGVVASVTVLYRSDQIVLYALLLMAAYTAILALVLAREGSGHAVLVVHLAGVATLVPLLFAPAVASRGAVPFFMLSLVPLVYAFTLARRWLRWTAPVLIALFGVKAVDNAAFMYGGFEDNARALAINDRRLRTAAAADAPPAKVELFEVPEPRFIQQMPYDKPIIGTWMKKYYGLDQAVTLGWRRLEPAG